MLQNRWCYVYVAGPGPGPLGTRAVDEDEDAGRWWGVARWRLCALPVLYFVRCEYEELHQDQIWRINTMMTARGRSVAQGVLLLERPAQRPTGWCDRCVGTQLPKPHPASRLHLRLAFDGDVQTRPEPGQIDFGRLLVMGNAATILKFVRQRTREKRRCCGRPIAHRQRRSLPASLPTKYSGMIPRCRIRRQTQAQQAGTAE